VWKYLRTGACALGALLAASATAVTTYADDAAPGVVIRPDASPSYYIVTRPDARRWAWPMCGGYFVKEVNKPKPRRADGTWQREGHALELDASALGWSKEELARFNEQFGQRHALVRGKLQQMERGSRKADVLAIDEGWLAQALSRPIGTFFGVKDTGIVCIMFPCLSIHERTLNFRVQRLRAGVDLAASGASNEQVEAGYKAHSEPAGILAVGEHQIVSGSAARGLKLAASEF
jgi:hypothetical protein